MKFVQAAILLLACCFICSWVTPEGKNNISTWSIYIGKEMILGYYKDKKNKPGDFAAIKLSQTKTSDSLHVQYNMCGHLGQQTRTRLFIISTLKNKLLAQAINPYDNGGLNLTIPLKQFLEAPDFTTGDTLSILGRIEFPDIKSGDSILFGKIAFIK